LICIFSNSGAIRDHTHPPTSLADSVANSIVFRRKSFCSLRLSYVLFASEWLFPAKSLEGLQFARSQGHPDVFFNGITLLFKGK
jgi:hypothetical protein